MVHSWFIWSKNPRMSASNTQFTLLRTSPTYTASRPKPVRKALEVHLVNLIQDGDYGLLNNLVLQGRNPQRTLPPIGLRDIDSPRRLRLVCATVYAAVQIDEPTLQPRSVLLPRLTVNARCCLPLQCEIAL